MVQQYHDVMKNAKEAFIKDYDSQGLEKALENRNKAWVKAKQDLIEYCMPAIERLLKSGFKERIELWTGGSLCSDFYWSWEIRNGKLAYVERNDERIEEVDLENTGSELYKLFIDDLNNKSPLDLIDAIERIEKAEATSTSQNPMR